MSGKTACLQGSDSSSGESVSGGEESLAIPGVSAKDPSAVACYKWFQFTLLRRFWYGKSILAVCFAFFLPGVMGLCWSCTIMVSINAERISIWLRRSSSSSSLICIL